MPASEIAPPALAITLFGPIQVQVHGLPMPTMRSRKVLWLLALLTLRHDRPVQREWLAGTLWPDMDQSQAFANLRPALSDLRRALAEQSTRIQSPDRLTLLLDLTDADVDLLTFDAAIKSGKLADLEKAVALYQGPLLEDCHEEWIPQERAVREQNCLMALLKLGETALAAGEHPTAVGHYQRAASLDPWSDTARRGWMEALAKGGDSNAALQVYRKYVEILRSDPSAVPDKETSALYERLRNEARRRANAPSVVVRDATPVPKVTGYLPHPLTDLVGREDERLEVAARLRRSRLVTLTGLGGIGKTRLAIAVASEAVGEYTDGVWMVALEALSDGSLIASQIASVLGLRETPGRTLLQSLTEHLCKKRLLLILDNCEQVLQASAQVVEQLLRECAGVRILATSRVALAVTGETVWAVPALTAPDPQHLPVARPTLLRVVMSYESVQLFVERAQSVQKSFAPTGANALAVAQVCSRLEGIPLAIELAAARVRVMTVEQISSRLENYLGFLTLGSRTAQSRQQTLRATLDWSYALLSEAEQLLLGRLSVFAGGCVLEAAERVCVGEGVAEEQVLNLLTSLVDKSLVVFEERGPAEGRYRLLEMVRQYAAEGLQASGETAPVKTRHRDWFLALAETAEPHLKGNEQANWQRRLEPEQDNLRAALARCETEAVGMEAGLRLAGALHRYWYRRGDFNEGQACLRRALEREGAEKATAARAKALNGAGALAYCHGDFASPRALNEESLTIQRTLGDRAGAAVSLNNLGDTAYARGEYGPAGTLYEESLAIRRELGDRVGIANALYGLGNAIGSQGDGNKAHALYEESLTIRREVGDKTGIANSLYGLGMVAYARRDFDMVQAMYEEGLAIRLELGEKPGIANSLGGLGSLAYARGDYETARTLLEETLAMRRELGDKAGIGIQLYWLGIVANANGDHDLARTYLLESLTPFRETGHSSLIHALGLLGHLDRDAGDCTRAYARYEESLQLRHERGDVQAVAQSMEDFARLAEREGQFERGVRLLGAAAVLYTTSGRPPGADFREDYQRTVTANDALNTEAFTALWDEGRAMTLEQAVAYALKPEETSSTSGRYERRHRRTGSHP